MESRIKILSDSLVQRETVQSIIRSHEDKICNNSIAGEKQLDVSIIEAVVYKPANMSCNSYSLFQAELRRNHPALFQGKSLPEQRSVTATKWAAVGEKEKQKLTSRAAALKSAAQAENDKWVEAREACMQRNVLAKEKQDAAAATKKRKADDDALERHKQQKLEASNRPVSARVLAPVELTLRKHNDAIKAAVVAREQRKLSFVARHWTTVEPFVTKGFKKPVVASAPRAILPLPLLAQPKSIGGVTMRDYQLAGLNYLLGMYQHGCNAILGDEMGLGKTLQTISMLSYLKFEAGIEGPHLIIVPLSVFSNWIAEFKRFSPKMRVVQVHSADEKERERLRKHVLADVSSYDVAITTYEMAKSPAMQSALVSRTYWRYVILDEGHIIKNEATIISQTVRKMHCEAKLLITGTPLQNNLHEFWSILNFLEPTIFGTPELFDQAFDIGGTAHSVDHALLTQAHALAKVFMLRRVKANVEKGIPPKVEKKIVWYGRKPRKCLRNAQPLTLALTDANPPNIPTPTRCAHPATNHTPLTNTPNKHSPHPPTHPTHPAKIVR
jgi:SNF2 family DNA or RNA helicase